MRSTFPMLVVVIGSLALVGLGMSACAGAQLKGTAADDIDVVLRRIDVVKAGYDQMELRIIVAINNGTDANVDVEAFADLALVGPSTGEGDGSGGGAEASAEEGTEEDEKPDAETPTASGLDGVRHKGSGRGTAVANNTSELPITILLPLPADPDVLGQVLSWKKARVHIAGKVKIGFLERTIAGERDLATPQLPEMKLKGAQIAKVDDAAAGEAFFTLLLENTNTFEVVVDKVSWKISIKDKELRIKEDGSTSVPGSAVEEYNESIELNDRSFTAKELKTLLNQPSVPYLIDASIEVRGIKKDFTFTGDMQFPR